jgi:hypothetical protein
MPLNSRSPVGSPGEKYELLWRLKPATWKSKSPTRFCQARTPKLLIWRWFSLREAEAKSLTPLTVSRRLGV